MLKGATMTEQEMRDKIREWAAAAMAEHLRAQALWNTLDGLLANGCACQMCEDARRVLELNKRLTVEDVP